MSASIEMLYTKVHWNTMAGLAEFDRTLIKTARRATAHAHSPYSKFCVGCAIRLVDDRIVTGSNQENASYGLTVCAERTAIFSAFNRGLKRSIAKMAITARPADYDKSTYRGASVITPCGACRQVIKEAEDLAGKPIVIFMDCYDDEKIARVDGISNLLPMGFGPKDLGIDLTK